MGHGGRREGAGRAPKEPTKTVRIPISRIDDIKKFISSSISEKIPLYGSVVRAGFPSPADDYIEDHLDLNSYLVKNPAATFLVRAKGDSMTNAAINSGDILVVDRSIEPTHGKIIIAAIENELTVKRLYIKGGVKKLIPENSDYPDIIIGDDNNEVVVWGIVTHVIHKAH